MATELIGVERTGDCKLSTSSNNFTYTETSKYLVQASDVDTDYWEVITTEGLPKVYLDEQYGLRCVSKSATRDPMVATLWHVTAEFSSETTGQTSSNDPNPTTWVPLWGGKIDTYEEPAQSYKHVNYPGYATVFGPSPFMNSSRSMYPDPLMVKQPIIVYEFAQYESAAISDKTIGDRNETTNDATFRGFAKWTLKCNTTSFTRGRYFGFPAVLVNYTVAYKASDWTIKPLNIGYDYYAPGGTVKITSPKLVALDENGLLLGDTTDAISFRHYFGQTLTDFSAFLR